MYDTTLKRGHFASKVLARPDRDQIVLRLGTRMIEHRHTLWPVGAPPVEEIREHVLTMLDVLEQSFAIGPDGRPHRYLPMALQWVPSLFTSISWSEPNTNSML